jgi:6-phosphogluconolactonase (cycloisomerase 2 family)
VGALTSVSTDFTAGGRYARIDPRGRFLYLTGGNAVVGFTISPQNGVLAPIPGSPFDAGAQTEDFDIDPSGTYLYVPSVLGQALTGFRIDATTGSLSRVPGSPIVFGAGTNPNMARVDKSGRSLFVSSSGDNMIRKYSIAPADGSLTLVSSVSVPDVGSSGFLLVATQ